jgi:hypothetical protein
MNSCIIAIGIELHTFKKLLFGSYRDNKIVLCSHEIRTQSKKPNALGSPIMHYAPLKRHTSYRLPLDRCKSRVKSEYKSLKKLPCANFLAIRLHA